MSSSNTSTAGRIARRAGTTTGSVVLLIVGAVIDVCGVVNVPGGSFVSEGAVRISSFGTVLALLAVAAWVTVLWRVSHPLVVVIAGGVVALIGMSYLLFLVGAVAYVRRRPDLTNTVGYLSAIVLSLFAVREILTPWGGALTWFLTAGTAAEDEAAWLLAPPICVVVFGGAAAGLVVLIRARARADRSELRVEVETRRADALAEQTVRQAERERIARDMHDALAHRLSVVSLHAGALEAAAGSDGDAGAMARTVREQTHFALQDMRGLIGDLRNPHEVSAAAPATLRAIGSLVAGLRAGARPATSLIVIESPERAGALFDGAVYRIVQEALTNAIKHGGSSVVDVYVHVTPESGARIRVTNAVGPSLAASVPGGGNGIVGIRERAAALGGEVWIGVSDGVFIADVTLPWQERA